MSPTTKDLTEFYPADAQEGRGDQRQANEDSFARALGEPVPKKPPRPRTLTPEEYANDPSTDEVGTGGLSDEAADS